MMIDSDLARLVRGRRHSGVVLAMGDLHAGNCQIHAAGDLDGDTPFYAASATKLLVTALMIMFLHQNKLALDAPFRTYLDGPDSARLMVIDGRDRTGEITLRQLLRHTSGLPDYFQSATPKNGLIGDLLSGRDRDWSFGEAMEMVRNLPPHGAPGETVRAHYADTNFQILGRLIEVLAGAPLERVMADMLFAPLDLRATWLVTDPADTRPRPLRYRNHPLAIPKAMASFRADGGLVTTAREGLALVRAFFGGVWFPLDYLASMRDWRRLWFPLSYGTGIMRFALPSWMTALRPMPELIGHSGLSGAVLFHQPATGLCFAGTVNQIDQPGTVFRLMARAAHSGQT